MMSFTKAVKTCYEKSFDIGGKASRSEFWWFTLYLTALPFVVLTLGLMSTSIDDAGNILVGIIMLWMLSIIASIPAYFCVNIRRWNDIGLPGWLILINLIPYFGTLINMIIFCKGSVEEFDDSAVLRTRKQEIVHQKPPQVEQAPPFVEKTSPAEPPQVEQAPPFVEKASPAEPPVHQTVYQTIVHGDYVEDRDTIVKDSVLNRSNIGGNDGSPKKKRVKKHTNSQSFKELKELKEMHDSGVINDTDYEKMKYEILKK